MALQMSCWGRKALRGGHCLALRVPGGTAEAHVRHLVWVWGEVSPNEHWFPSVWGHGKYYNTRRARLGTRCPWRLTGWHRGWALTWPGLARSPAEQQHRAPCFVLHSCTGASSTALCPPRVCVLGRGFGQAAPGAQCCVARPWGRPGLGRSRARSPLQAGTRLSWCSCFRTDPQVPSLLLGLFQMT